MRWVSIICFPLLLSCSSSDDAIEPLPPFLIERFSTNTSCGNSELMKFELNGESFEETWSEGNSFFNGWSVHFLDTIEISRHIYFELRSFDETTGRLIFLTLRFHGIDQLEDIVPGSYRIREHRLDNEPSVEVSYYDNAYDDEVPFNSIRQDSSYFEVTGVIAKKVCGSYKMYLPRINQYIEGEYLAYFRGFE